jgi:hypothetical protein
MDFSEVFDNFINENNLTRTEGDKGVQNLEAIAVALGYREESFKYGDPISRFLSDNPGAIEAILEWISESNVPEWAECLEGDEEDEEGQADRAQCAQTAEY